MNVFMECKCVLDRLLTLLYPSPQGVTGGGEASISPAQCTLSGLAAMPAGSVLLHVS